LANVDRFSKFFHQVIHKKILYVHITKIYNLACNMLLHYLVNKGGATVLKVGGGQFCERSEQKKIFDPPLGSGGGGNIA